MCFKTLNLRNLDYKFRLCLEWRRTDGCPSLDIFLFCFYRKFMFPFLANFVFVVLFFFIWMCTCKRMLASVVAWQVNGGLKASKWLSFFFSLLNFYFKFHNNQLKRSINFLFSCNFSLSFFNFKVKKENETLPSNVARFSY